jgi:hypothetical protein
MFIGFLITCYICQIGGINALNTFISEDGKLFIKNPPFFLGMENYDLNTLPK